jgi:hypothetical protein
MANATRAMLTGLAALVMLVFAANSWSQTRPPILEKMAKTYGLDSYEKIEAIRYTFNLDLPGFKLSRSWEWEPKTGKVSYEAKRQGGQAGQGFL